MMGTLPMWSRTNVRSGTCLAASATSAGVDGSPITSSARFRSASCLNSCRLCCLSRVSRTCFETRIPRNSRLADNRFKCWVNKGLRGSRFPTMPSMNVSFSARAKSQSLSSTLLLASTTTVPDTGRCIWSARKCWGRTVRKSGLLGAGQGTPSGREGS